jgi:hypothetical protein
VSTFISTLDIPWPRVFTSIMSRVNVINLNLLTLPKAAWCVPLAHAFSSAASASCTTTLTTHARTCKRAA